MNKMESTKKQHQSSSSILTEFVTLCGHLADRQDMNQAGGGNGSAKEGDLMYIKGSGTLMSEVSEEQGYTQVVTEEVLEALRAHGRGELTEDEAGRRVMEANRGEKRPSIETYLHALLPATYVLHLHGVAALVYGSSPVFKEALKAQQSGVYQPGRLLVGYAKPGAALALLMEEELRAYRKTFDKDPDWILLQNHGLIGAGESVEAILSGMDTLLLALSRKMGLPAEKDEPYRQQTRLKEALQASFAGHPQCLLLCEEEDINGFLKAGHSLTAPPVFPDTVVYCGMHPVVVEVSAQGFPDLAPVEGYLDRYGELPRLYLFSGKLYAGGDSLKKCRETIEVFKVQAFLQVTLGDALQPLPKAEARALLTWEAEKYRQKQ